MMISVLDAPLILLLGFVSAFVYQARLWERNKDWFVFLGAIFVGAFWVNSLLSYMGIIEPWIVSPFTVSVSPWIALFYVLSYPLWFRWGGNQGFLTFGRNPQQGGFLWLFRLGTTTEPFEPAWETGKNENVNKDSSEK